MNNVDKEYLKLANEIICKGVSKSDRTGTGTISLFGRSLRFNMLEGFPILTSKRVYFSGILHELLWFLGNHLKVEKYKKFGLTNLKYLVDNGVNIWVGDAYKKYSNLIQNEDMISKNQFIEEIKSNDEFALKWGELGPIYQKQWVNWGINDDESKNTNQIEQVIKLLLNDPDSRRILVNAWNPSDVPNGILPPCHYSFQFYTEIINHKDRIKLWCDSINKSSYYGKNITESDLDNLDVPKRYISLLWNQRSWDYFLGAGFNISSYSLLLIIISKEVNMIPKDLIVSAGDVHIYNNHINQMKEQINNETFKLPTIEIANKSIFNLQFEDIKLNNYISNKAMKGELSN